MKGLLKDILIAIVIAFVVIQFVRPTVVKESSMEPTLYNNNYIFISRMAYKIGEPQYGDIIVFRSNLEFEDGRSKNLIKRVIGLPGDVIMVTGNKVFRNGTILDEPYIKDQDKCPGEVELTVPDGCVFAMGDNREVSIDSRSPDVGCVPEYAIAGKAFFRLFPFGDAKKL